MYAILTSSKVVRDVDPYHIVNVALDRILQHGALATINLARASLLAFFKCSFCVVDAELKAFNGN